MPLHGDPIFCSAIKNKRIEKIIPKATKLIENFFKHNVDFSKPHYTIMIVGVPNVGECGVTSHEFILDRFQLNCEMRRPLDLLNLLRLAGKSSIINAVRESVTGLTNMAAKVGAEPGVTRHVMQTIRVSERPKIYLVDSPG